MEEVDNIIVINLQELGVIESDEELKNLNEIKPEQIYLACVTCLAAIDSKKAEAFPQSIPRGTSAKVNVTSELANIIKGLGYKGDLGFDQIMYPNANDSRKLLMWLIDTMPKRKFEEKEDRDDGKGKRNIRAKLEDLIARELTNLIQTTWFPLFAAKSIQNSSQSSPLYSLVKQYSLDSFKLSSKRLVYPHRGRKLKQIYGMEKFYSKYLKLVSKQTKYRREFPPSIFFTNLAILSEQKERENEWNTKGLGSNLNPQAYAKKKAENISKNIGGYIRNAMSHVVSSASSSSSSLESQNALLQSRGSQFHRKRQYTTEDQANITDVVKMSEEELHKKRQQELDSLQSDLSKLEQSKEELANHIKALTSNIVQIEALILEEDQKTQKLEKEYLIKKRTFDLLPNAESNILQLQEISAQSSNRLIDLAREWEKYRSALVEEFRKLRSVTANVEEEMKAKVEKMKVLRQQMKEIAEDVKSKDEKIREKLNEFNKIQKEPGRAHYTDRILDFVKSVKKQKAEIDKTLLEIRTLHKEINSTSDTLNRTFLEIDELVYQDAKKNDATAKEAYKQIVSMNENFKKLIKNIEEIGSTQNSILTLESKLKTMQDKISTYDFKRIEEDLKDMKSENLTILEQIQQQSSRK